VTAARCVVATFFVSVATIGACKLGSSAAHDGDATSTDGGQRGCRDNDACAADEYCQYTPGLCGRGSSAGTCRRKPVSCQDTYSPVCGCNGIVFDNECAARAARVDLAAIGGCHTVPDWASCGARYCDVFTSYCEIYLSDVPEPPTTYTCKPLPLDCKPDRGTSRSCECFPSGTACLTFCGFIQTGSLPGFHLTCQGVKEPK